MVEEENACPSWDRRRKKNFFYPGGLGFNHGGILHRLGPLCGKQR
jgi:hypothetical protein